VKLAKMLQGEGIALSSETIEKLMRFSDLLHEWNKVHNLTGARTVEAIYANIIDALYPLNFIDIPKDMLDVGTGAGFPGLVLAISLPQTDVVLSEPLKKRVAFLKYACIDLGITNVKVEAKRVETITHTPFELITSRAVTNTKLLLELTGTVSDAHTQYLFYKGSRVFDEVEGLASHLTYEIVQKEMRNYLYMKGKECS